MKPPCRIRPCRGAFTVLETLVAATVLVLMLSLVFGAISGTSAVTRRAGDKISSFQSARTGFDILTETLSQATINSYWDYVDSGGNFLTSTNAATFVPARYARQSDLHFLIGEAGTGDFPGTAGTGQAVCFQAPTGLSGSAGFQGLNRLLNTYGFYVEYGEVDALPSPPFNPSPEVYRYRLMQAVVEAEDFAVYERNSGSDWLDGLEDARQATIAENIVFLAVWPRKSPGDDEQGDELSGNFSYDSRDGVSANPQPESAHQLPPVVQITMVALDEATAKRVCVDSSVPTVVSSVFAGLFTQSNQDQFEEDLAEMQKRMGEANLGYRVFTGQIPLRESKML